MNGQACVILVCHETGWALTGTHCTVLSKLCAYVHTHILQRLHAASWKLVCRLSQYLVCDNWQIELEMYQKNTEK